MTFPKMVDDVLTRNADISKDPYVYLISGHDKAMRIGSIMEFWKWRNGQCSNRNTIVSLEGIHKVFVNRQVA